MHSVQLATELGELLSNWFFEDEGNVRKVDDGMFKIISKIVVPHITDVVFFKVPLATDLVRNESRLVGVTFLAENLT